MILFLDTFSVINLNSPWAGQYFLLVVIYVAGNKKLLCSRIAIAIRHTKYFALRPFKFRKASGNSGQQKLNLFGCRLKGVKPNMVVLFFVKIRISSQFYCMTLFIVVALRQAPASGGGLGVGQICKRGIPPPITSRNQCTND